VSQITELASGAITAADTITVELVETDEHPTVVIVSWPVKPTVLSRGGSLTPQPPSRGCSLRLTLR
jgi:hypothetical protein